MQLSSYGFIFIFLPLTLAACYGAGRIFDVKGSQTASCRAQQLVLILSSAVFVCLTSFKDLAVLAISILFNFLISLRVRGERAVLFVAVAVNVLLLGYFKYAGSFFPLGISFYTFIQIDYLYALYRGREPFARFSDYAVYASFFPRISAGPITDYEMQSSSFAGTKSKKWSWERSSRGLFLLAVGLFKKAVIADSLAQFADAFYALEKPNMIQAWAGIICYAFMLYFDFSGYSDMAVAVASFFGYKLPVNFDSPYLAEGIGDFWDRWHISLTKALGRLVYIPLGGSRRGKARTYLNIMAVFLISGIWHGSGFNFVLWGLGHGVLVCLERMFKGRLGRVNKAVSIAATFIAVSLLWVPFRAPDIAKTLAVFKAAFNVFNVGSFASLEKLANDGTIPFPDAVWAAYLVGVTLIAALMAFWHKNSNALVREFKPTRKRLYFTVALLVISTVHLSRLAVFVYTNF